MLLRNLISFIKFNTFYKIRRKFRHFILTIIHDNFFQAIICFVFLTFEKIPCDKSSFSMLLLFLYLRNLFSQSVQKVILLKDKYRISMIVCLCDYRAAK